MAAICPQHHTTASNHAEDDSGHIVGQLIDRLCLGTLFVSMTSYMSKVFQVVLMLEFEFFVVVHVDLIRDKKYASHLSCR